MRKARGDEKAIYKIHGVDVRILSTGKFWMMLWSIRVSLAQIKGYCDDTGKRNAW
jgi:hypothetical protein